MYVYLIEEENAQCLYIYICLTGKEKEIIPLINPTNSLNYSSSLIHMLTRINESPIISFHLDWALPLLLDLVFISFLCFKPPSLHLAFSLKFSSFLVFFPSFFLTSNFFLTASQLPCIYLHFNTQILSNSIKILSLIL